MTLAKNDAEEKGKETKKVKKRTSTKTKKRSSKDRSEANGDKHAAKKTKKKKEEGNEKIKERKEKASKKRKRECSEDDDGEGRKQRRRNLERTDNCSLGADSRSMSVVDTLVDERLRASLSDAGITSLFEMQNEVVPAMLDTYGDVAVCAPTGSGKTLAYALPIVQSLLRTTVRRLRAVVIVPTRGLAGQVADVFESLVARSDIAVKCVSLYGQWSYEQERERLVERRTTADGFEWASLCDVIVCTPGRLVEHVRRTSFFTLEHLSFLVLDEADSLFRNFSFASEWLRLVLDAAHSHEALESHSNDSTTGRARTLRHVNAPRHAWLHEIPLKKVLVSATLFRNTTKLAGLQLLHPRVFNYSTRPGLFRLPDGLREYMIVCETHNKVLFLRTLLAKLERKRVLCFVPSLVETRRLATTLRLCGLAAGEYSAQLHARERADVLTKFQRGELRVVVCSDAMGRGMDLAEVDAVVNYTIPSVVQTYMHRVGRTARAGRSGEAFTLVTSNQLGALRRLLSKTANSTLSAYLLKRSDTKPFRRQVSVALGQMTQAGDAPLGSAVIDVTSAVRARVDDDEGGVEGEAEEKPTPVAAVGKRNRHELLLESVRRRIARNLAH